MGFWDKLRGGGRSTEGEALYAAVVDRARDPDWYLAGGVPDTIDGRFGMVATVLALVLLRLEDDADAAGAVARLTEHFVTDMDGQLRQIGVGDVVDYLAEAPGVEATVTPAGKAMVSATPFSGASELGFVSVTVTVLLPVA